MPSASGKSSRGCPICTQINTMLTNAGTQSCEERLSAPPLPRIPEGLPPQTSEAFAAGRRTSSEMSELLPQAEARDMELVRTRGSGNRSRGCPICTSINARLSNAGAQFREECLPAQPAGDFWTLPAVRADRSEYRVSRPSPGRGFQRGGTAVPPLCA